MEFSVIPFHLQMMLHLENAFSKCIQMSGGKRLHQHLFLNEISLKNGSFVEDT
jgi:hypothetical protein